MLERMWIKGNSPPLILGVQTGAAALDISIVFSQRIGKQCTSRLSNTAIEYISKRQVILESKLVQEFGLTKTGYIRNIFSEFVKCK